MQNLNSSDDWINYMRNADFERAWEFSDKVLKAGLNRDYDNLPRHYQCIWDGTPLDKKRVLVRCYHGLGDTIQFIRYMPILKAISSEVIIWAQNELIDLLKTVEGIDKLIPLHDGKPQVDFDVDVEIMELPFIFRTTLNSIPGKIPYIFVSPLKLPSQNENISVGLVWQAGDWNQGRNIPFSSLSPLGDVCDANLYILQANAKKAGWEPGFGIPAGEFSLFDFARVIKGLDLLITVDSMPAHLAGALGVPVWLMLKKNCDWRWMENYDHSPWYPSMRIFRQQIESNWAFVIENIEEELKIFSRANKKAKLSAKVFAF